MDQKRLQAVERVLQERPELQPTVETMQPVLRAVEQDLSVGHTQWPAEAIARHLMHGGMFGYAGTVIMRKGGLRYAGNEYRDWLDGLILPSVLMDQGFAVLSKGPD